MYKKNILLIISLLFLTSCTNIQKIVGIEKEVPNEFLIEKRDPLVLPPNYKILPPDSSVQKNQTNKENVTSLENVLNKEINNQNNKIMDKADSNSSSVEEQILNQIK